MGSGRRNLGTSSLPCSRKEANAHRLTAFNKVILRMWSKTPAHSEGAAPVLRSVGTQVCWEFEGLMNFVSELGIKGSNFEGRP